MNDGESHQSPTPEQTKRKTVRGISKPTFEQWRSPSQIADHWPRLQPL